MTSAAVAISAQGASLHVDPITFSLTTKDKSTVLHITNADESAVRVQVSIVQWGLNADGHQVETPADSILLNPPIFQVEPHQTQFVRLGPRAPIGGDVEQAYRILIEEVPDPSIQNGGIRTVLRISVPLFFVAAEPKSHLIWSVEADTSGPLLAVRNDGNTHARIVRISRTDAAKSEPALVSVPFYLLPNERREWALPATPSGQSSVKLTVASERGEQEVVVGTVVRQP